MSFDDNGGQYKVSIELMVGRITAAIMVFEQKQGLSWLILQNHWDCTFLKGTNSFHLSTNLHHLWVNKVQNCTYRKGTIPVTAFGPFFF